MDVANTIVSNSLGFGILHDYGADSITIRYSNVWSTQGVNYSGTADRTGSNGNISVDPVYKSRINGNYRLNEGSPCIDAADGAVAPLTDLMGAPRYDDPQTPNTGRHPSGAYADLGAYEYVETAESDMDLMVTGVSGPPRLQPGNRWKWSGRLPIPVPGQCRAPGMTRSAWPPKRRRGVCWKRHAGEVLSSADPGTR